MVECEYYFALERAAAAVLLNRILFHLIYIPSLMKSNLFLIRFGSIAHRRLRYLFFTYKCSNDGTGTICNRSYHIFYLSKSQCCRDGSNGGDGGGAAAHRQRALSSSMQSDSNILMSFCCFVLFPFHFYFFSLSFSLSLQSLYSLKCFFLFNNFIL